MGPWPRPPAWDQAYGGHPPNRDTKGTLIVTKRAAESFRSCYLSQLRACVRAPSLSVLTAALFHFVRIERALIVKDVAG